MPCRGACGRDSPGRPPTAWWSEIVRSTGSVCPAKSFPSDGFHPTAHCPGVTMLAMVTTEPTERPAVTVSLVLMAKLSVLLFLANLVGAVHYPRADGGFADRTQARHEAAWINLATVVTVVVLWIVVALARSRGNRGVVAALALLLAVVTGVGGVVASQTVVERVDRCACEGLSVSTVTSSAPAGSAPYSPWRCSSPAATSPASSPGRRPPGSGRCSPFPTCPCSSRTARLSPKPTSCCSVSPTMYCRT